MMLNGKPVDALAMIVHRSAAQQIGRAWTKKLRKYLTLLCATSADPIGDVLPRQLFEVAIQAAVGTKVVARETLSAMRKDVTAGLYGGKLYGTHGVQVSADHVGHYERKLKHLNRQKEGKKRLKKLAGNIDIPQSAFFDVLSSRPRAFSTSARSRHPDHFSKHMPADLPPPSIDLSYVVRGAPAPFVPTALSAAERSAGISGLHRVLSDDTPDIAAVLRTFDQLASSSSHAHVFSTAELAGVMRALHRAGKHQTHLLRSRKTDVQRVHDELESLSERASRGLELALLKTISRQTQSSPTTALADIDSQMAILFPRPPLTHDERGVKRYRICVNYILHLCALAGDLDRFETWQSRLTSMGISRDSYAALASITLAAKRGDAGAIVSTYNESSSSIAEPSEQIILLNNTLWSLAIKEHWERVLPTFYGLVPTSPQLSLVGGTPELREPLPFLPETRPTAQTFSPLIHALAFQGHFDAALTIFRLMAEHGFEPHVPEYLSLFKGFTRHGIVPETNAGRLASSFPLWERFDTFSTHSSAAGHSVSRIWQRNTDHSPDPTAQEQNETATWTESNLREIFESFLHLSPQAGQCRAPRPEKVWLILMAFARTTNGDEATLVDVWDRLEAKFGEEGWWGWAVDGRLRRLRARMQDVEGNVTE